MLLFVSLSALRKKLSHKLKFVGNEFDLSYTAVHMEWNINTCHKRNTNF